MENNSCVNPTSCNSFLAIDYGKRSVGISLFHRQEDLSPYPLTTLNYQHDSDLMKKITAIVTEYTVEIVVLGLPKLLDGKTTPMTQKIANFGIELERYLRKKKLTVAVHSQDETLSTFSAKERMSHSPRYNFKVNLQKIDEVAATIILEDYLRANAISFTNLEL